MNMKLVLENQTELLRLVRNIASSSASSDELVDIEDLVPQPMTRASELDELCEKLTEDKDFRRKLVMIHIIKAYSFPHNYIIIKMKL